MAQKEFRIQNSEFRMRNWLGIIFWFLLFLIFITDLAFAESDYVLPYPSALPGSKFYITNLIKEKILAYWYFGSFGQFRYNLKQSDKYLVEAKTLIDYKQFLLGMESLEKSDYYFKDSLPSLKKAEREGKSISQKRLILKEAALKHIEYLRKIDLDTPDIFIWEPAKSSSSTLFLKRTTAESIKIRENSL